MNIINLTPHVLNILTPEGAVEVAPSGEVARVAVTTTEAEPVGGIPVTVASYGKVENLPDPAEGNIFVVSGMVEAQVQRQDVFAPGNLVRDGEGKPVGCEGLKQT